MIEPVRIHRDAKGTMRWLEPALERIRTMSGRFDGNAEALVNDVWKQIAEKSQTVGLFVAIEDDRIVGHALGFVQQYDGRWVAWINQVEMDRPVDRVLRGELLAVLGAWVEEVNALVKSHGIHVDEMMICTPLRNDEFARHSGFTDYRYLKVRKIPPVGK